MKVNGNTITVDSGTIELGLGCMRFTSNSYQFIGWDSLMICILDVEGELLWVNVDYWEEIVGTPPTAA